MFGDPLQPEAPPPRPAPCPRRRVPWRVLVSLVALVVGAALCVVQEREAGMLVLGVAVVGLGAPAAAQIGRRK